MAATCPNQKLTCCEDNDFSFSITSSRTFLNAGGSFTVPCPEGFLCEGGDQTVIIPSGGGGGKPWIPPPPTPNTPTILRLMGCSSEIVRELEPVYTLADYNAAIASILAEWQLQQATCEARQRQRPRRIVIRWLSPRELPVACVGTPYSYQLLATGGDKWKLTSATQIGVPSDFCVAATLAAGTVFDYIWTPLQSFPIMGGLQMFCWEGRIFGTPLLPGIYPNISFRITDSKHRQAIKQFQLRIVEIPNGTLIPMTDPPVYQLPDAGLGLAYNQTLTANATIGAKTWQVVEGTLPDGLTLDANTGVISGIATALEESEFTIRLTDNP